MRYILEAPAAATWSAQQRSQGKTVGFVPTMGALHAGHLTLVERAKAECGSVCVSIFVNPLQFNNAEDLRHYPRRMEQDRALLERAGCDLLFAPSQESIYRDHAPRTYDLGGLDEVLEGPLRPGHFQGVVNVVERLFHYVRPDRAYFGEKDRQQLAIIAHVAWSERWPERLVPCPTQRAPDGLALSSRNERLGPEERAVAPILHRALVAMQQGAFELPVEQVIRAGERVLLGEPAVRMEYLAIAHPRTLQPLAEWEDLDQAVALVAAWLGPVRLIDNITLQR